jgi:hypothetical protein
MAEPETLEPSDTARFRRNLVRVMAVQLVALALLGLLQITFTP